MTNSILKLPVLLGDKSTHFLNVALTCGYMLGLLSVEMGRSVEWRAISRVRRRVFSTVDGYHE